MAYGFYGFYGLIIPRVRNPKAEIKIRIIRIIRRRYN